MHLVCNCSESWLNQKTRTFVLGKKCKNKMPELEVTDSSSNEASDTEVQIIKMNSKKVNMSAKKAAKQDCYGKGVSAQSEIPTSFGAAAQEMGQESHSSGGLQELILQQLQRVNDRLDMIEEKVGSKRQSKRHRTGHKDYKKRSSLSTVTRKLKGELHPPVMIPRHLMMVKYHQ